ncbi:hypothetical protein KRMM14A1259_69540 [Krasilnikovia sp. MM14-A1259]
MAGGGSWAPRGGSPVARPGRTRRGLRAALVPLVVLSLAGLGLLPTSLAAFSATTTGPASSYTTRATFGLSQTAGCFSNDGSGSCTAATGIVNGKSAVVSPDGKHVYVGTVSDATNSGIAMFSRNATTGALTQLASPNKCLSNGTVSGCTAAPGLLNYVYDVAISPDGKHVYAPGYTSKTVAELSRDSSTGALTPLAGPNKCLYDSGTASISGCTSARQIDGAVGVAISPDGANVYVTSYTSNSLTVFDRNSTTGVLTQQAGTAGCITNAAVSGCTTGKGLSQPRYIAISPDGTSLYVASFASQAVAVFQRNTSTGALTQASMPNACLYDSGATTITGCTSAKGLSTAYGVTVAPNGRSVYVMALNGDTVAAFTRNTGTGVLTQLANPNACLYLSGGTVVPGCSSARAIDGPSSMTFSDDGLFAFVAGNSGNAVAAFRHDNTTGVLTQLTGTAGCIAVSGAGGCSTGLGLMNANTVFTSPDGRDVYAAGGASGGNGWVAPLNLTH